MILGKIKNAFIHIYNTHNLHFQWAATTSLSLIIAIAASFFSTISGRRDLVETLLPGVLTLFTISFAIAIAGIQIASDRYSYRVDSSILERKGVGLHFVPHLISIFAGIFIISLNTSYLVAYFIFIFSSSMSILSILLFIQWLLISLSPKQILPTYIERIDDEYFHEVENQVGKERERIIQDSPRELESIQRISEYAYIRENDPVDAFTDILRSRIQAGDTTTAKQLLNQYLESIHPLLQNRYREFLTSHSDSQLVSWKLYSPLKESFQTAIKEENHVVANEIITLLRKSVTSWNKHRVRGVPEVFLRMFGSVTYNYILICDRDQARSLAREYSHLSEVIASDINSPGENITRAMVSNFEGYMLNFTLQLIDEKYYKSADLMLSGFRKIIRAELSYPSTNPDDTLLMVGLIGEQFAIEQAKSKHIVANAPEVLEMDMAEWTIIALVHYRDEISEYGNGYPSWQSYIDSVMREINRINDALQARDKETAMKLEESEEAVIEVIRTARLFRSGFDQGEVYSEVNLSLSRGDIKSICESLERIGILDRKKNGKYSIYN